MKGLLFLLMIISIGSNAQEPVVYSLSWYEQYETRKMIRFVSLSDRYVLNKHEDSLAVPASNFGTETEAVNDYVRLRGSYRQRCLNGMGIADNDIVFLYDYTNDRLLRFYVRGLNLIAVLSPYSFGGKYPVTQNDYMIGFEINPTYIKTKYARYLVTIGKTNPFTQGKVKPIAWAKVDTTLFPNNAKLLEKSYGKAGDTFQFELNGLIYFVQNGGRPSDAYARHVVVINAESKQILFEKLYRGSEGGDPSALNYVEPVSVNYLNQYAGQLFKNQPPVIFGFMNHSFGCPSIEFIAENKERIYINCDNRH